MGVEHYLAHEVGPRGPRTYECSMVPGTDNTAANLVDALIKSSEKSCKSDVADSGKSVWSPRVNESKGTHMLDSALPETCLPTRPKNLTIKDMIC